MQPQMQVFKCCETVRIHSVDESIVLVAVRVGVADEHKMDIANESHKSRPDIVMRNSDFSIDHILNEAGRSIKRSAPSGSELECAYRFEYKACVEPLGATFNCAPVLDWLQYTRYRPPRLPSKWLPLIRLRALSYFVLFFC